MSDSATNSPSPPTPPTPLTPIVLVTFLASLGTGVLWNGLSFIAESEYAYNRQATFTLSLAQGLAYVIAAFLAGRILRALESRLSPRTVLALVFGVQAIVAPLAMLIHTEWTLWTVALLISATSALQWPVIESYLTAGRVGSAMRSALGWWNVVWMSAVAMALVGTGPVIAAGYAMWAIAAMAPIGILCAAILLAFRREPGAHHVDEAQPVPSGYAAQLHAARILLPVSYVVVAAMSPLMPFITERITPGMKTLVAATWLIARLAAAAALWRTHGWHGKWMTLLVAGLLVTCGFAVAVLAPSTPLLVAGLAAFGVGQGIIYYAAIYYAMAVGHADVDAAGTHEGLIGVGYAIGPAIGLITTLAASDDLARNKLFVIVIWLVIALAAWPAIRPWYRERRRVIAA
ncbi:MAG: MFS transporter [Phycisphaerae bacterium]|nr:MFS transporter [Phycisphaerae bacterium]